MTDIADNASNCPICGSKPTLTKLASGVEPKVWYQWLCRCCNYTCIGATEDDAVITWNDMVSEKLNN